VRVRCDVLPNALWGSTAGAHACGARSEYYKNIARILLVNLQLPKLVCRTCLLWRP